MDFDRKIELCTELFYAIITTVFLCFLADLLLLYFLKSFEIVGELTDGEKQHKVLKPT